MGARECELTPRAFLLGAVLSVVMAMANVYLGLKVGLTVSASIPSAVVSMLILRALKNSNVLENNLVQTAASAGESLAAGFIFTVPALLVLGHWEQVNYFQSALMILLGGLLGVVFSVPLRHLFIIREQLTFPEGVATAEILTADGDKGGRALFIGAGIGIVVKVCEGALKLWKEVAEFAFSVSLPAAGQLPVARSWIVYFGSYLSPALLGVGFIVGAQVASTMLIGGVISWLVAVPVLFIFSGQEGSLADASLVDTAYQIWSSKVRYLGVGAMLVGGVWTLLHLRRAIWNGLQAALLLRKPASPTGREEKNLSKQDMRASVLTALLVSVMLASLLLVSLLTESIFVSIVVVTIVTMSAFLFSIVSGYMAGLVGSSNNPVSGVTIATVLVTGLILAACLPKASSVGIIATIVVAAFVCTAAAIAGDNLQDLKAGYLLGATPYKQQYMQITGVVAAAFTIPPVLDLLHKTYVVGSPALVAPQATLIAKVTEGVFTASLPWGLITAGGALAAAAIAFEQLLIKRGSNHRFPVLALAVGIYLPLALSVAVAIGGLTRLLFDRSSSKDSQTGILLASGLITGEALTGIFIAVLAAAGLNLALGFQLDWLGVIVFMGIVGILIRPPNTKSHAQRRVS